MGMERGKETRGLKDEDKEEEEEDPCLTRGGEEKMWRKGVSIRWRIRPNKAVSDWLDEHMFNLHRTILTIMDDRQKEHENTEEQSF